MKVIAHAANTKEEIERALALGADLVEIDIWATRGHRFLVFHDIFLEGLGRHNNWTMYLTQEEIEELRREHRGLLYLEEALELVGGKVGILVELKRTRHAEASFSWIEEELLRTLKAMDALGWVTLISFDHLSLLRFKELCPEVRVGMICAGEWLSLWDEVERLDPDALLPHWAQTTPRLVEGAHRRGLAIYPWIVNREDLWEIFLEMGVDGIVTDEFENLLEFLGRKREVNRGPLLPR
ncbi:glycerophosphodiester phosphodiesterase [Candidatus Bipolaricaulota sp. J31]